MFRPKHVEKPNWNYRVLDRITNKSKPNSVWPKPCSVNVLPNFRPTLHLGRTLVFKASNMVTVIHPTSPAQSSRSFWIWGSVQSSVTFWVQSQFILTQQSPSDSEDSNQSCTSIASAYVHLQTGPCFTSLRSLQGVSIFSSRFGRAIIQTLMISTNKLIHHY